MASDHHESPVPPITLTVPTPPHLRSPDNHLTTAPNTRAQSPRDVGPSPYRPRRKSSHRQAQDRSQPHSNYSSNQPRSQANALDLPLLKLEHLILNRLHAYISSLHPTSSLARFAVQEVEREVRKLEGWLGELEPELERGKEKTEGEGEGKQYGRSGGRALPGGGEHRRGGDKRRATSIPPNRQHRSRRNERAQHSTLFDLLFPPRKKKRRTSRNSHARVPKAIFRSPKGRTPEKDKEADSPLRRAASQLVDRVAQDVGHEWASVASSSSAASSHDSPGPSSTRECEGGPMARSSSAGTDPSLREDRDRDRSRSRRSISERGENAEDRDDHDKVRRDYDVGIPLRRYPTTHRHRGHDHLQRRWESNHSKHGSRNRKSNYTPPRRRPSRKLYKHQDKTNGRKRLNLPSVDRNFLGQALGRVFRAVFVARFEERDKSRRENKGSGRGKRQDEVKKDEDSHAERHMKQPPSSLASQRSDRRDRSKPASPPPTSSHALSPSRPRQAQRQRHRRRGYRGLRISSPDMDVEIDLDGSEGDTTELGGRDEEQAQRRRRRKTDEESLAPSDSVSMRGVARRRSRSRRE